MPIAEAYTNTATIGTAAYSLPNNSTTLTPITVDGVYQVVLTITSMAIADQYQIEVLEKVTSGGSQLVVYSSIVTGPQGQAIVLPSLILLHGWDVQVKKLAGTDRSVSWSIRQVA